MRQGKIQPMRKLLVYLFVLLFMKFPLGEVVASQVQPATVRGEISLDEATESAEMVVAVEPEKPKENLTKPEETKSRLEQVLDSQTVESVWPANFFKIPIRQAVQRGVPANMFVLILLFPLTAALVAFSRNVLGVKGFGMFMPATVAVAFLSTGVTMGVALFVAILLTATLARRVIHKVRMQYFPRMAMLIWAVSMSVFGLLLLSPWLGGVGFWQAGIFPILLFILLADPFIEAQIHKSLKVALVMAVETVILALIAYWLMQWMWLQETVLLQPEMAMVAVMLVNYLISRYKGLRVLEVWRFKNILK